MKKISKRFTVMIIALVLVLSMPGFCSAQVKADEIQGSAALMQSSNATVKKPGISVKVNGNSAKISIKIYSKKRAQA